MTIDSQHLLMAFGIHLNAYLCGFCQRIPMEWICVIIWQNCILCVTCVIFLSKIWFDFDFDWACHSRWFCAGWQGRRRSGRRWRPSIRPPCWPLRPGSQRRRPRPSPRLTWAPSSEKWSEFSPGQPVLKENYVNKFTRLEKGKFLKIFIAGTFSTWSLLLSQ